MTSCPSGALREAPEGWGLLSKTVLPIHNSDIEGVLDGGPFHASTTVSSQRSELPQIASVCLSSPSVDNSIPFSTEDEVFHNPGLNNALLGVT